MLCYTLCSIKIYPSSAYIGTICICNFKRSCSFELRSSACVPVNIADNSFIKGFCSFKRLGLCGNNTTGVRFCFGKIRCLNNPVFRYFLICTGLRSCEERLSINFCYFQELVFCRNDTVLCCRRSCVGSVDKLCFFTIRSSDSRRAGSC